MGNSPYQMVQDVGVINRAVRSARILHRQVLTSSSISFGMLPLPVIVITRIATCLLRDPELNQYKPSFATVAERGIPQFSKRNPPTTSVPPSDGCCWCPLDIGYPFAVGVGTAFRCSNKKLWCAKGPLVILTTQRLGSKRTFCGNKENFRSCFTGHVSGWWKQEVFFGTWYDKYTITTTEIHTVLSYHIISYPYIMIWYDMLCYDMIWYDVS